jgi:hypothetical protein
VKVDLSGSGQGTVAGFVNTNEPSGSIKCGKFPDQHGSYQFLKENSVPWNY